jgi:hypothetical protein
MYRLMHQRIEQPAWRTLLRQRAYVHSSCNRPSRDHVCQAGQRVRKRPGPAVLRLVGGYVQHHIVSSDAVFGPEV